MICMKIRRFSPLPRDLSLEDLIPVGHFYRRLAGHLAGVFPEGSPRVPDAASAAADAEVGPSDREERRELARANANRHRWIAQNGRQERGVVR